jgi:hypothetical protein
MVLDSSFSCIILARSAQLFTVCKTFIGQVGNPALSGEALEQQRLRCPSGFSNNEMTSPACRLPSKVGVRWSPGNHMLSIMGREARRINENEEKNNILISACGYNPKQPKFTRRTSRSASGS